MYIQSSHSDLNLMWGGSAKAMLITFIIFEEMMASINFPAHISNIA